MADKKGCVRDLVPAVAPQGRLLDIEPLTAGPGEEAVDASVTDPGAVM
jgi:hypothetical protein